MFTPETETHVKVYVMVSIVVTLLIVILAGVLDSEAIAFWELTAEDISFLLLKLAVVALFIERAVEVIMTAWRGNMKAGKENALAKERNAADPSQEAIDVAQAAVNCFTAETKALALLTALGLGILAAAIGLRVLSPMVDQAALNEASDLQKSVFYAIDTFVTGALLGGGADGIHGMVDTVLKWFRKRNLLLKETINALTNPSKK